MKKVLVAAAGLMLAGTMASTAMADVTFSGDARARFYYESDYNALGLTTGDEAGTAKYPEDSDTHWNSRVRMQMKATTKGGAYAIARLVMGEGEWDGTSNTGDVSVNKAYIGIPMGPVTVEAGRMYRSTTTFHVWDAGVDSVQVKYVADNTSVVAFYDMLNENAGSTTAALALTTPVDDDDQDRFGVLLTQKFGSGWALTAAAMYTNDDTKDDGDEGFEGVLKLDGDLGAATLTAELAFQEEDLTGSEDDGIGGYISATMPLGAASITGTAGFTTDGYVADGDFGPFIMVSDVSQIATGWNVGQGGDWTFFALTPSFKVSENLTLGGNLAYVDVDADGDDGDGWEIGATMSYAITDGASFNAVVGYLDADAEEDPFGVGLELSVAF